MELHDSFKILGPNGEHQCLVFPVLGPSLEDMMKANALSGPVRHQICQQLANAVSFLHENGVFHGGIVNSANLSKWRKLTAI